LLPDAVTISSATVTKKYSLLKSIAAAGVQVTTLVTSAEVDRVPVVVPT